MRVAVLQMTSGIDADQNLGMIVNGIKEAKRGGAALLFTPEMCGLLDRNRERAAQLIVHEDADRVLAGICRAARDEGLWVHAGSLAVKSDDNQGKLRNRSFVIDSDGQIRARYDKQHLFDVDLPTGEVWRESASYQSGTSSVIVNSPIGTLGLSICYDLRFPALYSALSNAGATILAVPAAFTAPTGAAHWHVLLRARAIENACWVIAAAQTGHHADGRETYGHSLVIDPWGDVVLDMGSATGLGFAEIDVSFVDEVRKRIPVIAHRRPIPDVSVVP
jgi:deaminated glutathione amidase